MSSYCIIKTAGWCMVSCLLTADSSSMESMWSLALVIKAVVVATVDGDAECSSVPMLLQQQQFVESVSYLAQLGTGLSRKWLVEDLEVMDLVKLFMPLCDILVLGGSRCTAQPSMAHSMVELLYLDWPSHTTIQCPTNHSILDSGQ